LNRTAPRAGSAADLDALDEAVCRPEETTIVLDQEVERELQVVYGDGLAVVELHACTKMSSPGSTKRDVEIGDENASRS
jgi:hypothetical protein